MAEDDTKAEAGVNPQFFTVLMNYYIHQNGLMWNRLQFLVAVQAAVLTGAYTMRSQAGLPVALLVLGFLLSLAVLLMMKRDEQIRDVNRPLIEYIGIKLSRECGDCKPFTLAPTPKGGALFHATALNRIAFGIFMGIDLLLAVIMHMVPDFIP